MRERRYYRCVNAELRLGCEEPEHKADWPSPAEIRCPSCGGAVCWDSEEETAQRKAQHRF